MVGLNKEQCSYAFRWAARNGHTEIVKVLLPVSDPEVRDSDALRWAAAKYGYKEIVKSLLPISNQSEKEKALRWAIRERNQKTAVLIKAQLP